MSAEEAPVEAPHFQMPLRDLEACAGAEVQLKCVITGNPLPQGKAVCQSLDRTHGCRIPVCVINLNIAPLVLVRAEE